MKTLLKECNQSNFDTLVLKSQNPAAILFYGDNCPICLSLLPLLEKMAEEYEGKVDFFKINRDINRELAKKYHALASSTLVFFRNGKEACSRLYGYIRRPDLKKVLDDLINDRCEVSPKYNIDSDVLIMGGGPAGLSAAIYSARAKLYTVLIDNNILGGQVASTYHVENYPGSNGVIRGIDLIDNMTKQAERFGVQIEEMQDIQAVNLNEKTILTNKFRFHAKALILATGATPRKLNIEGEERLKGRGIHYCATCDGALYQDADVIVVGGGNSAVEEAVFLTRFAKKVTVIQLLDHLTASKFSQDELFKNPRIDVIFNSRLISIEGNNYVEKVTIENIVSGERKELKTDGVFIYIGMQPQSKLFENQLKTNDLGYVITDENMMTSIKGVFAAGDLRAKEIRQIATAVGDGTTAGIMAEKYINSLANERK